MWEWFKSLFRSDPSGADSFSDDEMWQDEMWKEEVIRRCYETGNVVMGNRNDDGTVTIQEFPSKPKGAPRDGQEKESQQGAESD